MVSFGTVPRAGHGEQFDGIMMLNRRAVASLELDRRHRESLGRIALVRIRTLLRLMRLRFGPRRIKGGTGSLRHIHDTHFVRGLARCFEALGQNDRDDLSCVADSIIFEGAGRRSAIRSNGRFGLIAHVLVGENIEHARVPPWRARA